MSKQMLLNTLFTRQIPGQLVIQITDSCNATCGQCGMRIGNQFTRHTLKLDDIKKIIDKAAANKVGAVSFTGGEPLLYLDNLIQMIEYAHTAGIKYIRTGTNGFLLRHNGNNEKFLNKVKNLVEKLANTHLRNFWISIDSADAKVHERLRGLKNVVKGIETSLPFFHEAGIYPSVNLGINRFLGGTGNTLCLVSDTFKGRELFFRQAKAAFEKFYEFVIQLGFTIANACYPMSADDESKAVYSASSKDSIVNFNKTEKIIIFKALKEVIPSFRSRIRIFSPLCSLHSLVQQYDKEIAPGKCHGGIDFFFIDAKKAHTYPCGYRGDEDLGKYWELDMSAIDRNKVCHACDWECFRDPSELFTPFVNMVSIPWYKQLLKNREFLSLWVKDLKYYQSCDYFNGRKPINLK